MIMGDLNYPNIDYANGVVSSGENSVDSKFFDKTQDLLLVQNFAEKGRIINK